jgi:hypothetical protein
MWWPRMEWIKRNLKGEVKFKLLLKGEEAQLHFLYETNNKYIHIYDAI